VSKRKQAALRVLDWVAEMSRGSTLGGHTRDYCSRHQNGAGKHQHSSGYRTPQLVEESAEEGPGQVVNDHHGEPKSDEATGEGKASSSTKTAGDRGFLNTLCFFLGSDHEAVRPDVLGGQDCESDNDQQKGPVLGEPIGLRR
jgi:hypothetical protein